MYLTKRARVICARPPPGFHMRASDHVAIPSRFAALRWLPFGMSSLAAVWGGEVARARIVCFDYSHGWHRLPVIPAVPSYCLPVRRGLVPAGDPTPQPCAGRYRIPVCVVPYVLVRMRAYVCATPPPPCPFSFSARPWPQCRCCLPPRGQGSVFGPGQVRPCRPWP